MSHFARQFIVTAFTVVLCSTPASASGPYPDRTDDGLERIESKKADAVYWKEGADLGAYDRVRIDAVEVSFRKNWLRDQNRDRRSPSDRVSSDDMDDIRAALAVAFREEFSKELEKGGYEVVDENGPDVLLLKAAIVDLDVIAPDTGRSQPGITRTYTASAGEMTLNLDLRDSVTNSLIGRAIDRREDHAAGGIQYSSRITNRAEAERILRSWASILREALDDAHDEG
jgi:hypothetical protein